MPPQPLSAEPLSASAQTGLAFPPGFVWGAATAAFQVEGSTTVDGREPSVWDTFAARPGAIRGGDTGEPAADHYRRAGEDVELMRSLGLGAYRFSLAWPRIRPGGVPNVRGIAFYDRLVDSLLAAGIQPWATLYHWDLPQRLEDLGGWTSRDTAYRFAEYAETIVSVLGDRVASWSTLNEPWCAAMLGYAKGIHAPGRVSATAAAATTHHLLLGHGLAMDVLRRDAPRVPAGITLNLYPVTADSDSPEDAEAARRVDGQQNRLFLDPVLRGGYPADVAADLAPFGFADVVRDGDEAVIAAPVDWLGVNYYRGYRVAGSPRRGSSPAGQEWLGAADVHFVPDPTAPLTDSGWEVQPAGLTTSLLQVHRDYRPVPLYVTENGASYPDVLHDGEIADSDRVAFLEAHLRAAHDALAQGVDLRGYFYWSLLDNFEWAEGYAKRFGLVHVDYATQRRTPKRSAQWYSEVIARGAVGVN
ncbi:GH1 family beta-glucosidase [Amycolatopsis sp. NPDC050768]|uniref:GH1 family beta-glucosidase n=1 Tax=Amycolatopsis sp. NPDC050768 TaxID=3154839 RepID=UPI0033F1B3C5